MPPNPKHKRRGGGAAGGNLPAAQPARPPASTYDGPPETPGRGRAGSASGSGARVSSQARASSQVRASSRSGSQTRRVDPARDPPPAPILNRNVDFGGQAYDLFSTMPTELEKRNGRFGKLGKKALIEINSHAVKTWPDKNVYQYDVTIGSGVEKRGLIKAVWESNAIQSKVGKGFIFDGNKIGWSPVDFPQGLRIEVDLDAERGRAHSEEHSNKHRVRIVKAKNEKIDLSIVRSYLDGKCDFDSKILEAISFLDHLLRETPSKELINLRRSYFSRTGDPRDRYLLGMGVEAMKGIYQSIRMAEGRRLVVNVDVSNSCFWHEALVSQLAQEISGWNTVDRFIASTLPNKDGTPARGTKILHRLVKNKFYVKHRGQAPGTEKKMWTIRKISNKNAKTYEFEAKDRVTGETSLTTVFAYYLKKYNVRLDKWQLPLLETERRGVLFPMELAIMGARQRYPFKLNEEQTAKMIKFAVSRPQVRRQGIKAGLDMLKWPQDTMLKGYNLQIEPNFLKTESRILDPPEVLYGKNATARPMYSGRWDLRGKTFFKANSHPLKSWGICVLNGRGNQPPLSREQLAAFKNNLIQLYKSHGGRVEESDPIVTVNVPDIAEALNQCFLAAGNKAKLRPQMLLVILPFKDPDTYQRVKKNCDCRYGIMSQCVQAGHVMKNSPQYCSNVLMKFNCKLGGTTSALKSKANHFKGVETMCIGADVSHPAPGLMQASMAAITVSIDRECCRYAAAVETNGHRVEMITGSNVRRMLTPLIDYWMKNVSPTGHMPKHVYYFRDGVSEGRYIPMMNLEVADIKQVFDHLGQGHPGNMPKFTVVVAEKRHHIRFFPPNGPAADKNGNPVPGVIVDKDVTTPFENDVYLCSHAAIQGTARPTHYTIIMDEMNVDPDKFQAMLYEHCYQYQRATTPVSLFPAVYYAHLASKRAESHIDMPAMERYALQAERRKHPGLEAKKYSDEQKSLSEMPRLMPFVTTNHIQYGMWYI